MDDPHLSKIDPTDARLKLPRYRSRTVKKGPVILVSSIALGLVFVAFFSAMTPANTRMMDEVDGDQAPGEQQVVVPAVIKDGPDYSDPLYDQYPDNEESKGGSVAPPDVDKALLSHDAGHDIGRSGNYADMRRQMWVSHEGTGDPSDTAAEKSDQELEAAMMAGLFFSGPVATSAGEGRNPQADSTDRMIRAHEEQIKALKGVSGSSGFDGTGELLAGHDPNDQRHKNEFMDGAGARDNGYLSSTMQRPKSPYELKAGSIIPVSLLTGINSDIPGEIIGQVREAVYDTVSGNHLLIPQGSRLMAKYDSMVSYGQDRVMVCWNRLIRPDGTTMDLGCTPGTDLSGYSGFADQVDHHYGRLFTGVVLSSLLSATASTSQGSGLDQGATGFDQLFAANAGAEINNVGQQITKKNLEVQPTIKVRPGFSVNVLVNKDLIIPPFGW